MRLWWALLHGKKWLWEPLSGLSTQDFKAVSKLRPWPGLLCMSMGICLRHTPLTAQGSPLLPNSRHNEITWKDPCLQSPAPASLHRDTLRHYLCAAPVSLSTTRVWRLKWLLLNNTLSKYFCCPSQSQYLWLLDSIWKVGTEDSATF